MKFLAWLLSVFFAFNLGAQTADSPKETDDELRNKVQEHLDVIMDESAALVDDVTDSIRNDERIQDAEKFIQNVQDVAEETLDDLNQVYEDTKTRVEEKFGDGQSEDADAADGEKATDTAEDSGISGETEQDEKIVPAPGSGDHEAPDSDKEIKDGEPVNG